MFRVLLAELITRGVRLEPHEAVAIAQELVACGAASPLPGNVRLGADGSVECAGCEVTPGPYEIAIFLQTLLPPGRLAVPGGLRYTIARGLHEVDARPFDSVEDLSAALERFEKGDRRAVIGQLVRRNIPFEPAIPMPLPAQAAPLTLVDPVELPLDTGESTPTIAASAHRGDSWAGAVAIAAALVICAVGGFASVKLFTRAVRGQAAYHDVVRAPAVPASTAAPSSTLPSAADAIVVPRDPVRAARPHGGVTHTPRPAVRIEPPAADPGGVAHRRPLPLPALASDGSAMFIPARGARHARDAVALSTAAGDYDLEVMTIPDDGATRSDHVQPSPDGRWIAFDSDRDGERGIYIAGRDGSGVRRISSPGTAAAPTWSPDARRIAYIRAEAADPAVWNLWIHSLDEGRETRLTGYRAGQTLGASWFPDGRRICYAHDDELVIVDLSSGRERVIGSPVKGRLVRTPAVSPDGTRVIFQVLREGAWLLTLADGSLQHVITDPTADGVAWAPDARHVAFHSRRDRAWGIYVIAS